MQRAIERIKSIPDELFAWYELCKIISPESEEELKTFARQNHLPINEALSEGFREYQYTVKKEKIYTA